MTGCDADIVRELHRFRVLGANLENLWNLVLTNEFHMTNDSYLFTRSLAHGYLPLYEGKMIHQFTHVYGKPKYWIEESKGRNALGGSRNADDKHEFDYQRYRLAFRQIASNTNERSLIATMLPPNVFANNKLTISDLRRSTISNAGFYSVARFSIVLLLIS